MSVKKVSDFGFVPDFGPDSDHGPVSSPSLRDAGRRFINSYRAAGYSRSYVQSLEETVGYLAHCSEDQAWPSVAHITTEHVEEYFSYSRTRPKYYGDRPIYGNQTLFSSCLNRIYRQLHCFWGWLAEWGTVARSENVLDGVKRFRVEERIVPTLSDDQVADLLSLVDPRLARAPLDTFRLLRNGRLF